MDVVETVRIAVVDLSNLAYELLHLRRQVTELQTDNTRLFLENRDLRAASRDHAHCEVAVAKLDALPGRDGVDP
jgi:hypothetical protein